MKNHQFACVSGMALVLAALGLAGCSGEPDSFDMDSEQEDAPIGTSEGVATGERVSEPRAAFEYLKRYGYFPNEALQEYPGWKPAIDETPANPDEPDELLHRALRLYQEASGLEVTGELDEETRALMAKPRCSFPDLYTPPPSELWEHAHALIDVFDDVDSFTLTGSKWGKTSLTYGFNNYMMDNDLSQSEVAIAVRAGFNAWSAASPLVFAQSSTKDISIGFYQGSHLGEPATDSFDGYSGVLAHATKTFIHFDNDELWTMAGGGTDLESVATHEAGHSLGLSHSADSGAVMYAYYDGMRRGLRSDDVAGIRSLYGDSNDVGVIAGGDCPAHAERIIITMDDEDTNNINTSSGWIGSTSNSGNTTFQICRVDGSQFKPLTTTADSSKYYAVLKLGAVCPNGSISFSRYFDNEDSSNANSRQATYSAPANIAPNVSNADTTLEFCLFTYGSSTMSSFPSIAASYGVFAGSNFSASSMKGSIFIDDEDTSNANSYSISNSSFLSAATDIVSSGSDTTIRMARVSTDVAVQTLSARGGSGGGSHDAGCVPGDAIVGIQGSSGTMVDALGVTCAVMNSNGTLGTTYTSKLYGGSGGGSFTISCPSGQVAVGVAGRSGTYIDQIGLLCADLSTWKSSGTYSATSKAGGSGGGAFTDACSQGYVLNKLALQTGNTVDREQGQCSRAP